MISIIIPAFNHNTLHDAITSVVSQNTSKLEIIIIDDSLSTKIEKLINHNKYPMVRYYKNKKNIGTTLSRKKGIELAQGQYIGFLDDDDIMIDNNLESKKKQLDIKYADFIFCNYIIYNKIINQKQKIDLSQYESDFKKNILYKPGPFLQCCLFQREFILGLIQKFDKKSEPSEDWDFFIEISKSQPIVKHCNVLGFEWRLSKQSQSFDYEKEMLALEYIINKHKNYMKNNSIKILSLQYRKLGSMQYYLKKTNEAKTTFRSAFKIYPLSIKNICLQLAANCPNKIYHWLMQKYVKKII
jgi:glycosyltransferase involved in cell wall biosynthesis